MKTNIPYKQKENIPYNEELSKPELPMRQMDELLGSLGISSVAQLRSAGFVEVGSFTPDSLARRVTTLLGGIPGVSYEAVKVVDKTLISDKCIPGKEYIIYARLRQ